MALLSITDLFMPLTADQIESTMLSILNTLGFTVTAWQPGGAGRTIVRMNAVEDSQFTNTLAIINQAGFLDYAALPSVTPDPSIDPTAPAFGWLDILAQSGYQVFRPPATSAEPVISLHNASVSSTPSFPAGTFHIVDTSNNQTYTNTAAVLVLAGATTPFQFVADVPGAAGSLATSASLALVTSLSNVTAACTTQGTGTNAGSNQALVTACRAKLASISVSGPEGAYEFFAVGTPVGTLPPPLVMPAHTALTTPITKAKAFQDITTGIVNVVVTEGGTTVVTNDLDVVTQYLFNNGLPPTGVQSLVRTATANNVTFTLNIGIRKNATSTQPTIISGANTAIGAYINTLPIGGFNFGSGNFFPIEPILAAVKDSSPDILNVENVIPGGTEINCLITDILVNTGTNTLNILVQV